MNPQFPIYIPSKGRADSRFTIRVFEHIGVPYRVIVEEQEFEQYAAVVDRKKLLVLDKQYQRDYDPYCRLKAADSRGSGPARNFAWDHSLSEGHAWHWVIDDNIESFFRMNRNMRIPVSDGSMFAAMESFASRYKNVAMAGPDYMWVATGRKEAHDPFTLNTRIYSCILIRNDIGFRWRGRFNEDTDLSLRVLKAGWCTVMFKAFLQRKLPTMTVRGGNTDSIYVDGTLAKSRMIVNMHPDVARLAWKFKRWHHYINYNKFKNNKLILRDDIKIKSGVDNFGMQLLKTDVSPYAGLRDKKKRSTAETWKRETNISVQHVQGGGVPGGHWVIQTGDKLPFVPQMKEANSIPLRHSDVVVDIGAFVGTFAIRAARFPVAEVHGYEPTQRSFDVMSKTQLPNLHWHRAAIVQGRQETVDFYLSHGNGVRNSLKPSARKDKVTVPAADYLTAIKNATVVKIDIEGGEYDLPIVQPHVRAYIIDFHPTRPDWEKRARAIIKQMKALGFKTVCEPNWKAWTANGSWMRDMRDKRQRRFAPMLGGKLCCGCGTELSRPTGERSLCEACWNVWTKKHRIGYALAIKKPASAKLAG